MSSSITTKTGDLGCTRLYSGEEVEKFDSRVQACGDIDELNSALGVVRALIRDSSFAEDILSLQRTLFVIGSMVATTDGSAEALSDEEVDELTRRSAELESHITMPTDFILPGGNEMGARLDLARSVARRAERSVVQVHREGHLSAVTPVVWLNRLSDYLWLLARREEGDQVTQRRRNETSTS